jgi:hypothetical protein
VSNDALGVARRAAGKADRPLMRHRKRRLGPALAVTHRA